MVYLQHMFDAQEEAIRRDFGSNLDASVSDHFEALSMGQSHESLSSGAPTASPLDQCPSSRQAASTFAVPKSATEAFPVTVCAASGSQVNAPRTAASKFAPTSGVSKRTVGHGHDGLSILRRNKAKLIGRLAEHERRSGASDRAG